jgi:hypothetical protein
MTSENRPVDILELDQELLYDGDAGGGEAFVIEPDVLLLDTPAPVAGPVMAIAITPPRGTKTMPEPSFGGISGQAAEAREPGAPVVALPPAREEISSISYLDELLTIARESAAILGSDEARSRKSLYATLAGAYDLSLAVMQDPRGYARLLERAGLKMQDRAPLTPILKLVFGADYDKTRLTEYAAVLAYGHRKLVPPGHFARFLEHAEGGLKGLVALERLLRNGDTAAGRPAARSEPSAAIARRLRKLEARALDAFGMGEDEFTLVIARRAANGTIAALAEVPHDVALLERAARRVFAEQMTDKA